MSDARRKFYWAYQEQKLYVSDSQNQEVTEKTWHARDLILARVYLLEENSTGDGYDIVQVPSNHILYFALKLKSNLGASAFLASCLSWTYELDGSDHSYIGSIALNVAALNAEVGDVADVAVECKGEFTLYRSTDGNHVNTTQLDIDVIPDLIRGGEAGPVDIGYIAVHCDDGAGNNGVRLINVDGVTVATFYPGD